MTRHEFMEAVRPVAVSAVEAEGYLNLNNLPENPYIALDPIFRDFDIWLEEHNHGP